MPVIRVLLVDDHRALLDVLALRLAGEPDIEVVGTATSASDALALLPGRYPDVAVLDLGLGQEDGVSVGRRLTERQPGLRLVALTGSERIEDLMEAVSAGFRGWVRKASAYQQLVDAVHAAARNETRIPHDLLTPLLDRLLLARSTRESTDRRLAVLTSRECEVLQRISEGLSRDEISRDLGISANTVRTHSQSILSKLEVHSSVAAAALWRAACEPQLASS